jgi:hypothetical protein
MMNATERDWEGARRIAQHVPKQQHTGEGTPYEKVLSVSLHEMVRSFEAGVMSRAEWWEALTATYFAIFKAQAPESMKACDMSHAIVDALAAARLAGVRAGIEAAAKVCVTYMGDQPEDECARDIRALDAAKIAQEMSE